MRGISVVIPTFNRCETLPFVLEGFNKQTFPSSSFEVILVDSMSDDGTEEFLRTFQPKFSFRYIRQENRGRAGARNRGILEAGEGIIFFTDSDIIPEENLLEKHAEFHQTHLPAAAVGWETRIQSIRQLSWLQNHPSKRFRLHSLRRKKLHWLYFLTGNLSIPKKDLLKAGLFDEAFQGYGYEDLELGYRVSKAGLPILYLPEAVNYHLHPRSLESRKETQRLAGISAVYFFRKHKDWRIRWLLGMNPFSFLWYRIVKYFSPLRQALENLSRRKSKSIYAEILAQYYYLTGVEEEMHRSRQD